jgi:hypothetical protein
MLRRHIACQWNGQAARLVRNKCRGRTTQRPYVRLRPLAYVTRTMPRGSIGALPERGAEAYMVWSGHVSAPDPRLALIKAWVFFIPRSRDPAVRGGVGCRCWPRVVARVWGEPWSGPTHGSFTTRLEIAAWVPCLHTVVRGTPVLGY